MELLKCLKYTLYTYLLSTRWRKLSPCCCKKGWNFFLFNQRAFVYYDKKPIIRFIDLNIHPIYHARFLYLNHSKSFFYETDWHRCQSVGYILSINAGEIVLNSFFYNCWIFDIPAGMRKDPLRSIMGWYVSQKNIV